MQGANSYSKMEGNSSYLGFCVTESELRNELLNRIKEKILDEEGTKELIQNFNSLAKTDFELKKLEEIFKSGIDIEDWRIGEALAECYLEENCNCYFYYQYSRDAKNSKANLAGADVVGFYKIGKNFVFVFGEVKTSTDKNVPPAVVYGRSGISKQIENIKMHEVIRQNLIRWLAFKVVYLPDGNEFKKIFQNAISNYLKNTSMYNVVGILVRDTSTNESDLSGRYAALKTGLAADTHLELVGLYLPVKITEIKGLLNGKS